MTDNLYKAPASDLTENTQRETVYAGFWIRVLASVIDSILIVVLVFPLLTLIYGTSYWENSSFVAGAWDVLFNYVLPAVAVILFWVYKSATPGKMLFGIYIVDAKTGGKPTTGQLVGRYAGYYVSMLVIFLGFLWVAFDARKQGWHDKMSGTVVVKKV
jgi:uncharacterized RDD family membrane protein YckC